LEKFIIFIFIYVIIARCFLDFTLKWFLKWFRGYFLIFYCIHLAHSIMIEYIIFKNHILVLILHIKKLMLIKLLFTLLRCKIRIIIRVSMIWLVYLLIVWRTVLVIYVILIMKIVIKSHLVLFLLWLLLTLIDLLML
jgi:hypothetical protein